MERAGRTVLARRRQDRGRPDRPTPAVADARLGRRRARPTARSQRQVIRVPSATRNRVPSATRNRSSLTLSPQRRSNSLVPPPSSTGATNTGISSSTPASMHYRAMLAPRTLTSLSPAAALAAATPLGRSVTKAMPGTGACGGWCVTTNCGPSQPPPNGLPSLGVPLCGSSGDEAVQRHRGRVDQLGHGLPPRRDRRSYPLDGEVSPDSSAPGRRQGVYVRPAPLIL
jgi:hypothetical protein